jgi:hypothetical protein
MERGEVPPNWDDLCRLSAESATDESIDLALEWMAGQQMDVDEDGDQYDTEADKLCVDF